MATSSLQPSSNPFRDPNRTSPVPVSPQATGTSSHSLNPFLSAGERVGAQATGASQYFTPQHTGAPGGPQDTTGLGPQHTGRLSPQYTGALNSLSAGPHAPQSIGPLTPQQTGALAFSTPPLETQNTGSHPTSSASFSPPVGPPPQSTSPDRSVTPQQSTYSPPREPTPPPQSVFLPPPGPPPQQSYAPPSGPPPAPRAPSPTPTVTISEPPPPYTPAADVRHGEIPLETGPRRAYAPEWHPDGQRWRNEQVLGSSGEGPQSGPSSGSSLRPSASSSSSLRPSASSSSSLRPSTNSSSRPNVVVPQVSGPLGSWGDYPGQGPNRFVAPPTRQPTVSLGRANTTASTGTSHATPGPPTAVPTPGRALLNAGRVLAYPAGYECQKCHLTGYQAYDPSNPCRDCWSLFAQPYEGALTYAPWDSPEDVTSDAQNLQRPLPAPRGPARTGTSRPLSHPQHSSYSGLGQPPGSLPPADWSRPSPSALRPSLTISHASRPSYGARPPISYSGRPPPGSLVVRPGDSRIGGRICWKCSGEGWQYKSLGLETKTCSACNGLGRLF